MDVIHQAVKQLVNEPEESDVNPHCLSMCSTKEAPTPKTPVRKKLSIKEKIGEGTFGVVYRGEYLGDENENRESVAVKRVRLNPQYAQRELQILKMLKNTPHKNVLRLRDYSTEYSEDSDTEEEETTLYLVMDYYPTTLAALCLSLKSAVREEAVYTIGYQLLRGLEHIHALDIMHRDIKPENILYNPQNNHAVIADFGSSKLYKKGVTSTSYVATRYYRAPECILDNLHYDTKVDIWSMGCVFGEMVSGAPLFVGKDNVEQLYQIFRRFGYPSDEEILEMNPELDVSCVKRMKRNKRMKISSWIFGKKPRNLCILLERLLTKMHCLSPVRRINAGRALNCGFFFKAN